MSDESHTGIRRNRARFVANVIALALVAAVLASPAISARAAEEELLTYTHRLSHPLDDITVTHTGPSGGGTCIDDFDAASGALPIGTNAGGDESIAAMLFRNVSFPGSIVITNASLRVTSAATVAGSSSSRYLAVYAGPRAPAGEINSANAPRCSGADLGDDLARVVAVPGNWTDGQEYTIEVTQLIADLRAGDAWQNGLDLAISIRDLLGHFDGLGLELLSSEGGSPVELEVTYFEVPLENALIDPQTGLLGDLSFSLPEQESGTWYNLWTLNVHRVRVFEDGDTIGRGDIFVMANPAFLGDASGVGVFCWPADGYDAPVRVAPRDLGNAGPGGQPMFEIPCPADEVWHIGNNDSVAFAPPLSTTTFMLPSSPIEEDMWADCLPQGFFYVGEEDTQLSLLNPHLHLDTVGWRSGGSNVAFLSDPDRCRARPGEVVTSVGVGERVEIEYSFELERYETVDVYWGVYLVGYEGLTNAIDWNLGWWPDAATEQSNVNAMGNSTLPYPSRAVSVNAPGARCIPLEIRTAGLVASAPCLEQGTYTATHQSIAADGEGSTPGGDTNVRFVLTRFAVGEGPPSCLECQASTSAWVFLSTTGLAGLVAVGLYSKRAAYARVGATFLAAIALTSAGLGAWTTIRSPLAEASEALDPGEGGSPTAIDTPIGFVWGNGDTFESSEFRADGEPGSDPSAGTIEAAAGGDNTTDGGTDPDTPANSRTTTTTQPPPNTTSTTTNSTTTTTTTQPPDVSGPKVSDVTATPDTIFTSGNPPDVATVSATVSDQSGIGIVTLYYRAGRSSFQVWDDMELDRTGAHSVDFGPFGTLGTYEFRIRATDGVGNSNCNVKDLASCPGGFVEVVIP